MYVCRGKKLYTIIILQNKCALSDPISFWSKFDHNNDNEQAVWNAYTGCSSRKQLHCIIPTPQASSQVQGIVREREVCKLACLRNLKMIQNIDWWG